MRKVAVSIVGEIGDPGAEFVELALADVRTPGPDDPMGLVLSRYHPLDKWLTPSGWSAQPPPSQLRVAVVSAPGTQPMVLKLPTDWTRYIDPYEVVNVACPVLDVEGTVAWHYTGEEVAFERKKPAPVRITPPPVQPVVEEQKPEKPSEPEVEPVVDPPIDEIIDTPVIEDPLPPDVRPRFPWAAVAAAAALVLVVGGIAGWYLTRSPEEQAPEEPPLVSADAESSLREAQELLAQNDCGGAAAAVRSAIDAGSAEASFMLGDALDPSDPASFTGCLARSWDAGQALHHYAEACKRGDMDKAAERVRRLSGWIEDQAANGSGDVQFNAQLALSGVEGARADCGL